MVYILLSGFGLGLSLIAAIGAQNAFVLKSGITRSHVFWICLICATSDAVLILAGIFGLGGLLERFPDLITVFRYGGALFLFYYGALSARSAWQGGAHFEAEGSDKGLWTAIVTCLALTWLNPHVYLDTVILVGSVALQSSKPYLFGAGAIVASFVFFFSLGYGARFFAPLLRTERAWRVLDALIAVIMFSLGLELIIGK